MTDEDQIRTLIERWAQAVHDGDMATVLAGHDDQIVMFDVPPPQDGVRGIDAYEQTWRPFFEWQRQGAVFEIVELDVTAGADVAFAHALLRCGMPAEVGEQRLRLTLGLCRRDGRWIVTHEHHSFADTSGAGEDELRALHDRWFTATRERDVDALVEHMADDVVSYEHDAPLEHVGVERVRAVCARGFELSPGVVTWDVPDLRLLIDTDLAVAWGLNRMVVEPEGGAPIESWSRGTRVFQRRDGGWTMVHQHVSFPYDPETGEAQVDLRP